MDILCLLFDLMKDKKSTVCDVCFNAYENMIQYINIQNGDINDDTWIFFFDKINELYAAKKEIYVKKCVKIIEFFENNLGKNKFEELLIKLNRKDEIKKYENWILLGSKKSSTQMSFKDFIKSKKNNKDANEENN